MKENISSLVRGNFGLINILKSPKGGIGFGLGYSYDGEILPPPSSSFSPNELFFGGGDSESDRSSGLSYKDREERVRQMRERQQIERQQKLVELKEQAAAAQRFREQQEALRRQRLDDMRSKDSERRSQVEERKRIIQQAEQERREAVLRKSAEREHRLELKRRQERSNVVFAFGSSTPRMLDPKENLQNYFGPRRATSTTNVNLSDSSSSVRRTSEVQDTTDLSRKRATSAHSLNRKLEDGEEEVGKESLHAKPSRVADLRMSTSMYEVFNWDDSEDTSPTKAPYYQPGQGDEAQRPFVPPPPTAARRRTDLLPAFPSLRDTSIGSSTTRSSPRHRSPGVRSGTATPGSSSRPTSALSQTSGGSTHVVLRSRTSPRKPRPLSIAGSTVSSADKPRETAALAAAAPPSAVASSVASPNRETTTTASAKPSRAKSAGSDRSAPSTPAKAPRGTTPKRTPAQVKAENAAKKAAERSKLTQKLKTTPLQSPSVESKPLPSDEKKTEEKEVEVFFSDHAADNENSEIPQAPLLQEAIEPSVSVTAEEVISQEEIKVEIDSSKQELVDEVDEPVKQVDEPVKQVDEPLKQVDESEKTPLPKPSEVEEDKSQTPGQRTADKPVTGYASEEQYKAALAEKRRQAREAKERELELERQRKLEEEERERREEEEYLRLMEEQKRAEEERLRKAIEEAERQRVAEALKKEEEEKQRIEAEKIEQQKKIEAEEKMRKEEEERQMRKSRVAAIMSRTRGRGSGSTPTKADTKTPSEEGKGLNDSVMSSSMTESLINNLSSSMTDSMIVQAIESHQIQKDTSETSQKVENEQQQQEDMQSLSAQSSQPPSDVSSQPLSDLSSQPLSDLSSQLLSDNSSQSKSDSEIITQISNIDTKQEESQYQTETVTVTKTTVTTTEGTQSASLVLEAHVNGNTVPMETTPTSQVVDLLGSFNGVNGINQNGIHSGDFPSSEKHDNQFGSLDPLNSTSQTILTTETKGESFDQIIDLNQVKLTNEDAVNSNPPPPPIIAFEENLNKKSQQQSQDNSSNVPDERVLV
ncbi:Reticulocyte-binding protein 2-like protein a [Armadillidium nasatum]|uniref:Reticulocyte-binding protein 2-like protein a n=1 Tax=Armadillidium nasatum TaxID=96803 RepID=A0A5N5SPK4_9CRUS|nr:Reticulocyte-binding protein 2-like protein a [Armadillidium nasatum]